MAHVDDAKQILVALGLPKQQQTKIAAFTLLALARLRVNDPWSAATQQSWRVHDLLGFMKTAYNEGYAENTRETVRRQVLHQLEQARVVDRNPDNPALATNSPHSHYALSSAALTVIRAYGTPDFPTRVAEFIRNHGALLDAYRAQRKARLVVVTLSSGEELPALSPGKHNELQAAILRDFRKWFAATAVPLYYGDAANKDLYVKKSVLADLRIPFTEHDKLPDVILYEGDKQWLYLIEAVTSHGPVSPKRWRELEAVLTTNACPPRRIYVSAFPNWKEFKRHLANIAWETEVWLADIPDHMIHFNGEKFLT